MSENVKPRFWLKNAVVKRIFFEKPKSTTIVYILLFYKKHINTQLERRFFSVTKRAVTAVLEDAYRWYKKSLEKKVAAVGEQVNNAVSCIDA